MSASLARVERALAAVGVPAGIVEAGRCRTAAGAAASVGCGVDQIARSVILCGEDSGDMVLFPTAGGNRADPTLASAPAGEPLARADAAQVRAATGFAIGGVAPVGQVRPLRAFRGPRRDDRAEARAAAGTPRHVVAAPPDALGRAARGTRGLFTA